MSSSRGKLHLTCVRVANCVPFGSDEKVASVSCRLFNVDLPNSRVSTPAAAADACGGASFGKDGAVVVLPLGDSSLGVLVRAELQIRIVGRPAPIKAAASVEIDFALPPPRTAAAAFDSHNASASGGAKPRPDDGFIWCQLRAAAPPGGGASDGVVCGELLLRWERVVKPRESDAVRSPPPVASQRSAFPPLDRITEDTEVWSDLGEGSDSTPSRGRAAAAAAAPPPPPTRDAHGFVLRVPPRAAEEFAAYYYLRCEAQLAVWGRLVEAGKVLAARQAERRVASEDMPVGSGTVVYGRVGSGTVPVAEPVATPLPPRRVPRPWVESLRLRQSAQQLAASVAVGVPAVLRPAVWLCLSGASDMRRAAGVAGGYAALAACEPPHGDAASEGVRRRSLARASAALAAQGGASARQRRSRRASVCEEAARQIDLDLPRTFPDHAEFATADGRAMLRRVLCAHCARSPQVGYTQSLNFLAAFLLLQLPARVEGGLGREEAAFWLLECVIERLLPSYFTAQLTGVLADTRTLDALVASHPQLHALPPHLESLGLDLSLVSTQWLMLGFVTALPSETAPLRLWGVGEWLVQTRRLVRRRAWT